MPYIIMKRDDVPAGILQVLDLEPNTSLRNYSIDPPGQTKYINPLINEPVVIYDPPGAAGPSIFRTVSGLAAWIITNVSDGTGAAATGTFTFGPGPVFDGETLTIGAGAVGGPTVVFTFRDSPTTPTGVLIGPTPSATAGNFLAILNNADLGLAPFYVTAVVAGPVVTLTAAEPGTASNGITLADTSVGITPSGATMAAGADAGALTATQANDIAADILSDIIRFGDLTLPAVDADLASINAVIAAVVATASITALQLPDLLDLLAGRVYMVAKDVQVETALGVFDVVPNVGTDAGWGFVAGTLRHVFQTGALNLSVAIGELEGFLDSGFVYAGIPGNPNGEAVVVYNDDGTILIP
jgi:hypothetical protein